MILMSEELAREREKYANTLFRNFLKFKGIKKEDIIEYQGGLIPKYDKSLKTNSNKSFIQKQSRQAIDKSAPAV